MHRPALLLALVTALAACGGGDDDPPPLAAAETITAASSGGFSDPPDRPPVALTLSSAAEIEASVALAVTFEAPPHPGSWRVVSGALSVLIDGVECAAAPVALSASAAMTQTTVAACRLTLPAGAHTVVARFVLNTQFGVTNHNPLHTTTTVTRY